MSRTAVGGIGSVLAGCRAAASRVGLRSHLASCRGRHPESTGNGCSLLPVRISWDQQTQETNRRTRIKWRLVKPAWCMWCDPMCTESSFREEPENRKKKVLGFAMDGRRVSSLSVGSNESEGSGGTRVGEIFQQISNICLPSFFLYWKKWARVDENFPKKSFPHMPLTMDLMYPRWHTIFSKKSFNKRS